MVDYEYTELDRLENPHNYMYSEFLGEDFIQAYYENRKKNITKFNFGNADEPNIFYKKIILNSKEFLNNNLSKSKTKNFKINQKISAFSDKKEIITEDLILSLINEHFIVVNNFDGENLKSWIDFLVQRFEVTKKLYQKYHLTNLRTGKDNNNISKLYCLFSLLLTLNFSKTKNLKYLSTILKLNDLICSLEENKLKEIPNELLALLVNSEMIFVNMVSKNRYEAYFAS